MQERYCDCGRKVTVRFALQDREWRALIRSRAAGADAAMVCPNCGRRLDIDDLR
jgi:hypothetical protein